MSVEKHGYDVQWLNPLTGELLDYATARLAKFKLPKSIDYIDEMPRDPNGKLYKRKLRDPYWADRTARI